MSLQAAAFDPRASLRSRPMTSAQVLAVALCVVINMADGFDILASGFTGPAISRDWGLGPAQLGLLFSAGPAGMVLGALALSPAADLWGRRRTVLACLVLVALGMLASAAAPGLTSLIVARVVTGIGVAAAMATINTVVAEQANDRRRDLAVCLQAAGFPLGGVAGALGVYLIGGLGWRWVFLLGAGFSALLFAAVVAGLPESFDFLVSRRPPDALARVNRLLARLRLPPLDALPPAPAQGGGRRRSALAASGAGAPLICGGFFLLMFTFYFLTNWTPKLLTTYGLSLSLGVSSAVFMNLGGVLGDLVFVALTLRWPAARLGPPFMLACLATAVSFAFAPATLSALMPIAFLLGFLLFASMASLYAIVPAVFPGGVRTTGTGMALGLGRIGAVVGPYGGGLLIAAGWSRPAYLIAMAAPLAACAAMTWALSRRNLAGLGAGA